MWIKSSRVISSVKHVDIFVARILFPKFFSLSHCQFFFLIFLSTQTSYTVNHIPGDFKRVISKLKNYFLRIFIKFNFIISWLLFQGISPQIGLWYYLWIEKANYLEFVLLNNRHAKIAIVPNKHCKKITTTTMNDIKSKMNSKKIP